jgi:hypothetical protein
MNDGTVKSEDDEAIRRLLGWGGLDKQLLFFVEDEEDLPIRALLKQWPDLSRRLSVCRCFGLENLPKDKLLEGLLLDGKIGLKALIHRDRDFMTAEEVRLWQAKYKTDGVFQWVTIGADVEAYFCTPEYLAQLFEVTLAEATAWRDKAALAVTGAKKKFIDKRVQVNWAIWPQGGSPNADALWSDPGPLHEKVLGKALVKAIKVEVQNAGKNHLLLDKFSVPIGYEIGADLKVAVEAALA